MVKAEVPACDPHDDRLDLGGTTVELEPGHFAQVVAHERVLRDLADAEPERSLVMLAGKAGRPDETVAFRFAEALHREGFTRDVYFATRHRNAVGLSPSILANTGAAGRS
ncbi:hypothetical protein ACPESR_26985 [Nocardia testacea]|uniref:hypothetical protein n=1 Tax=Nocardia testacea TaxID=248551 RepID=UPI003C309509